MHRRVEMAGKMVNNDRIRQIPSQHLILTALTEREVEVLLRVAAGARNHEIAADLQVSIKTVEFHLSNIMSKLHSRSRTEAVVRAWQSRMIELAAYPDSVP
jgi:two-component system, NarL family, response regulator LiaR